MSTNSGSASAKSPLDAAQKIVAELQDMTTQHQTLAIRFATETLGLQLTSPSGQHAISASTVPQAPVAIPHSHSVGGHSSDIKSFTTLKAPKSDRQFTAVVAYFYQFEAKPDERKDTIDADLMKEAARLAGWPQVQRWSMTLTNAKNAGYLDSAGDGQYKLSSVGENLVAITLPGNESTRPKSKKKQWKKPARKQAKK